MTSEEKQKINPGLAAILSFFFSGLGQIYNGQITKGLLLVVLAIFGTITSIFGALLIFLPLKEGNLPIPQIILGVVFFLSATAIITLVSIYSIKQAYNYARKKLLE